jgi:hypothetical protein
MLCHYVINIILDRYVQFLQIVFMYMKYVIIYKSFIWTDDMPVAIEFS